MRQVTVLGSWGAYPEPDRACSGFLVECDGFRLVLDLGYATLPRLLSHCPCGAVDAVVITHEHPDHCIDLHGLFRMRFYGGGNGPRLPLYCTPGVLSRLSGLEPEADLRTVFDVHELPGSYRVGPFTLSGVLLPHHVPNAGVRLENDQVALAYTGDTGPDPLLADLGRDSDLYILDATDRKGEPHQPHRNLLTSEEAGYWATRAGTRRLMLTHFWPGNDRAASAAAARSSFDGWWHQALVAGRFQAVQEPQLLLPVGQPERALPIRRRDLARPVLRLRRPPREAPQKQLLASGFQRTHLAVVHIASPSDAYGRTCAGVRGASR